VYVKMSRTPEEDAKKMRRRYEEDAKKMRSICENNRITIKK